MQHVLTSEQDRALRGIKSFLSDPRRQVFVLSGVAGSGKTSIVTQHLPGMVHGPIIYVALAGKAVDVMRRKLPEGATAMTLHRLIYRAPGERATCSKCERSWWHAPTLLGSQPAYTPCAHHPYSTTFSPVFGDVRTRDDFADPDDLFLDPDAEDARPPWPALVVLDEASMIGRREAEHLLSLGFKVLALGDHFQIPPVESTGYFNLNSPDAMLTEIVRTGDESPIDELATMIRRGDPVRKGWASSGPNGQFAVVTSGQIKYTAEGMAGDATQVVCGTHVTRTHHNGAARRAIYGAGVDPWPQADERVICRRNYHNLGLFNGQQLRTSTAGRHFPIDDKAIPATLAGPGEFSVHLPRRAPQKAWAGGFTRSDWHKVLAAHPSTASQSRTQWAYGYSVTCHAAQGSEFSNVIVIDEGHVFRKGPEFHRRWTYTAVTRARETVRLVFP